MQAELFSLLSCACVDLDTTLITTPSIEALLTLPALWAGSQTRTEQFTLHTGPYFYFLCAYFFFDYNVTFSQVCTSHAYKNYTFEHAQKRLHTK